MILHGLNLATNTQGRVGALNLVTVPVDAQRVRVQAPVTPGSFELGLVMNTSRVLGNAQLQVVAAASGPALDPLAGMEIVPTGWLRLTGTNLGANVQMWLDHQLLPVMSRGATGQELYVRLPEQTVTGRLSVVSDGVRSLPLPVAFTPLVTTAAISPLAVVASEAGNGVANYTAAISPLAVVTTKGGWHRTVRLSPVHAAIAGGGSMNSVPA